MNLSIFIFTILFQIISCNENDKRQIYFRRENSLVKPFQGSSILLPNWDFFGSTIITQTFIKLTPDSQSKRGGIFNKIPMRYRNWEVVFEFKIDGQRKDLFGDGMAFWYVKDPLKVGPVFGHEDNFKGLGVFLDTYANQNGAHNHGHPYISAMVNNGSENYDHDRDGTHTEISGCEAKIRGVDHDTSVSVKYSEEILTVQTNIDGTDEFKECFRVEGVKLPTNYYIGFTAATGDLSDNHYLLNVRTFEIDIPGYPNEPIDDVIPSALHSAPHREHVNDPPESMSNFKFFMIILCALIGIVLLIAVGIIIFNKQNEMSRKRFY